MPRSWELARHDQEVEHQPALTWWEHAARWSRAIVATSVAAGIALVMVVRASPKETPETVVATAVVAATASTTDAPRAAFESAVIGHGSASFMSAALLPPATDLLIPLGSGGQTR